MRVWKQSPEAVVARKPGKHGWSKGPKDEGTELKEELEGKAWKDPTSENRSQGGRSPECRGRSGAAVASRKAVVSKAELPRTSRQKAMYEHLMEMPSDLAVP